MSETRPKVSVCMTAYNHEKFIAQAVESVLAQKTKFEVELVIGEDFSTDRTREILVEYQRRHPKTIRLLLRDRNVGIATNFFSAWNECRGEYMNILEGDDYWTDPFKLQKQVDFLDEHPDFVMCSHNALVVHENGQKEPHLYRRESTGPILTTEDFIESIIFQTGTRLFRRFELDSMPPWFTSIKANDWAINVLLSQRGKVGYMDEVMSVYRVHDGGIYSGSQTEKSVAMIVEFYEIIDQHLNYQFHYKVKERLARCHYDLVYFYQTERDWAKMRRHLAQAVRLSPASDYISWKARVKYLAVALCPAIYEWRKRDVGAGK